MRWHAVTSGHGYGVRYLAGWRAVISRIIIIFAKLSSHKFVENSTYWLTLVYVVPHTDHRSCTYSSQKQVGCQAGTKKRGKMAKGLSNTRSSTCMADLFLAFKQRQRYTHLLQMWTRNREKPLFFISSLFHYCRASLVNLNSIECHIKKP